MSLLSTTVVVAPSPSPTIVASPVTFSNPIMGSSMGTTTHMVSSAGINIQPNGTNGKGGAQQMNVTGGGYKTTDNIGKVSEIIFFKVELCCWVEIS